jgi:hypothetical protein
MLPKQENAVLIALLITGIASTLLGIIIALPLWILNGLFASGECRDSCVPSTPPEHTTTIHPLTVVIAFMIFGFLPLLLYLIAKFCRRDRKKELPTRSDHPNELW